MDNKYRVYDPSDKSYIYFTLEDLMVVLEGTLTISSYPSNRNMIKLAHLNEWRSVSRAVEIFVGIQDTHGADIYEGDVVVFNSQTYSVSYSCGSYHLSPLFNKDGDMDRTREFLVSGSTSEIPNFKVVGSINDGKKIIQDSIDKYAQEMLL